MSRSTSPGIERHEVRRGDALVAAGAFPRSYRLEVALDELEPIADGARLTVHHGTSRIPASRRPRRTTEHAQLRLAAPVVAARGDRVVLRGETTVGGGSRARPRPAAASRRRAGPAARRGRSGLDRAGARARARPGRGARGAGAAERRRARGGARRGARRRRLGVLGGVARGDHRHGRGPACALGPPTSPLDPGLALAELLPSAPWAGSRARAAAGRAARPESVPARHGGLARRTRCGGRGPRARARRRPGSRRRRSTTRSSPASSRPRAGSSGSATGSRSPRAPTSRARDLVVGECSAAGEITLARFRDLAGVGRRDAQLLLERMDVDGLTRRLGDRRVLRRAARASG